MKPIRSLLISLLMLLGFGISCKNHLKDKRPNILIAIVDATNLNFGAYGVDWVKTPAFDKVAKNGILFMNAYTPNSKCAPTRACILTGRNSWQLEAAANHNAYFPVKFKTYPEALAEHDYYVGYTGKSWAPGNPGIKDGKRRELVGTPFQSIKTTPQSKYMSNNDYAANFKEFLNKRPKGKPFCFWYGGHEAERTAANPYVFGFGIRKGHMKLADIKEYQMPGFLPDNDTVRTDMLDHAYAVEYFDKQLMKMINRLKAQGELENTLVVVTNDHGRSFPRMMGQSYAASTHAPLAIMWKEDIKNPGRTVKDFVSSIDLAPTFLQVAGVSQNEGGMQPISGKSLMDIFDSKKSGQVNPERDHVLIGKERHDMGRPNDEGYPIRGIVTANYLYLHNFKPNRWPAGNPETGYLNCDGSPTKTWILHHRRDPKYQKYWELAFGKRPADELYDMDKDPDNINNLAEKGSYQEVLDKYQNRLFQELKEQNDPRMFGRGEVFDEYPYASKKMREFYEKYINGKLDKSDAGWVNPSDFESKHPLK